MKKKLFILVLFLALISNIYSVKASCSDYKDEKSCTRNNDYSCVWNKTEFGDAYCNVDKLTYVGCGGATDIPREAPELISFTVNLLKIGTPIILIIVGIITLVKALAASKDDEIKKAQNSLIKKFIAAAMVFFIVSIVQFVILKVADDTETDNISSCLDCFLNNKCEKNVYYKTAEGSRFKCTYIASKEKFDCN